MATLNLCSLSMPEQTRRCSVASQLLIDRRLRTRYFSPSLFGEPVWDILLDLYVGYVAGRPISTSDVALAASTPLTTTLRWIDVLQGKGLIERWPDPNDKRRMYVGLTESGQLAMARYLDAMT